MRWATLVLTYINSVCVCVCIEYLFYFGQEEEEEEDWCKVLPSTLFLRTLIARLFVACTFHRVGAALGRKNKRNAAIMPECRARTLWSPLKFKCRVSAKQQYYKCAVDIIWQWRSKKSVPSLTMLELAILNTLDINSRNKTFISLRNWGFHWVIQHRIEVG